MPYKTENVMKGNIIMLPSFRLQTSIAVYEDETNTINKKCFLAHLWLRWRFEKAKLLPVIVIYCTKDYAFWLHGHYIFT